MIVFAHAGHWLTGIAFMLPPLAFMGWLGYVTIKERRRGGDDE
jgi:hypothetical protein